MKFLAQSLTLILLLMQVQVTLAQEQDLTKYVDPFIGTAQHGHVFLGAEMPFGMVQLGPDERTSGWDWCSGYNYSSTSIMGFSHTHLSGTGASDYGDILLMPTVGKVRVVPGTRSNPFAGYRSAFSHSTEKASPGFYSVLLQRYNVRVNLTATDRCGMHEYVFPRSDSSNVIIDLQHGIGNFCTGGWVRIIGNRWVEGMRRSQGWARVRYIYFAAEFSKPFRSFGTAEGGTIDAGTRRAKGDSVKAFVTFSTKKGEAILVRVGLSGVSLSGARKNLAAEMPDFDFNKYRERANAAWNSELNKIQVEGGTHAEKVSFYTALYHTMIAPNIFEDVDGKYFGMDHKIHVARGFNNYSVFSVWDIWRADMPLVSIIHPKRYEDFVRSLLEEYRQDGILPLWPLWGNETYEMIGYPTVPILFDAYMKGYLPKMPLPGFTLDSVFAAMKHSADLDWQGLRYYKDEGFIPVDKQPQSVSKSLEYSFEDWCIAQMAKRLGKRDDYRNFNQRSLFYQNVFDNSIGFMRGKMSNGEWATPFDPFAVGNEFTEANAWQYTFFVPQDVGGLIDLFGGKQRFADKLDSLFNAPSTLTGTFDPDITGMIGQDAQGDEQSNQIPYLYDYAGEPWKTQFYVRKIMTELYPDSVDGLPGNDDCGQISAWYVLSAMGFYQVTPGQNTFAIGSPVFRKVTIRLGKGRKFVIEGVRASDSNIYVDRAELNGKPYDHAYFTWRDLESGGALKFSMSETPNRQWGIDNPGLFAMAPDHNVVPMVSFQSTGGIFFDSAKVNLSCPDPNAAIHYTVDGSTPRITSSEYRDRPIVLRKACTLKAAAFIGTRESMTTETNFVESSYPPAKYRYPFSDRYSGGGPMALTDGLLGTTNYQDGRWQGFHGKDLDVTIDLEKETRLHEITTGCLQDTPAWIFLPKSVTYYVSQNGKDFRRAAEVENGVNSQRVSILVKGFTAHFNNIEARYIRVVAKNIGVCPPWHPGAGNKAWLFVDEVTIR